MSQKYLPQTTTKSFSIMFPFEFRSTQAQLGIAPDTAV